MTPQLCRMTPPPRRMIPELHRTIPLWCRMTPVFSRMTLPTRRMTPLLSSEVIEGFYAVRSYCSFNKTICHSGCFKSINLFVMDFNYSDIQIARLSTLDTELFIELIRVFEDVFEMKDFNLPDYAYLNALLKRDDFLVFVATKEGTVVGGLTIYVLHQYYSVKPLAYIYDLAVKTELQRKGLGKKLISAVKEYCTENDFEEVFVQADEVDDYALDFYRSTGITDEEKVRHFYYKLAEK